MGAGREVDAGTVGETCSRDRITHPAERMRRSSSRAWRAMTGTGEAMASRFFHRLGASLLDRTICASAGGDALAATYGGKFGMRVEHFAESRLILIWGSNAIASNLHFWRMAQQAKRNGAKLVCIDPRRTETADKCHQHIQLLPGTDAALALSLACAGCVETDVHRCDHASHAVTPPGAAIAAIGGPEKLAHEREADAVAIGCRCERVLDLGGDASAVEQAGELVARGQPAQLAEGIAELEGIAQGTLEHARRDLQSVALAVAFNNKLGGLTAALADQLNQLSLAHDRHAREPGGDGAEHDGLQRQVMDDVRPLARDPVEHHVPVVEMMFLSGAEMHIGDLDESVFSHDADSMSLDINGTASRITKTADARF